METIILEVGGQVEMGVLIESLSEEESELKLLADILSGKSELSPFVLYPHSRIGKPVKIIMMVRNLSCQEGKDCLLAIEKWVKNFLSPMMPAGWQADLAEPVIFKINLQERGYASLFFLSPVKEKEKIVGITPEGPVILLGLN